MDQFTFFGPEYDAKLDFVRETMSYDPETGDLTFRQVKGVTITQTFNRRSGYIQVHFRGTTFYAHRIAYFLMTGEPAAHEVDHINGDRSDNRWINLRPATRAQNAVNTPARSRTGFKGVYQLGSGRFMASITYEGQQRFLGNFETAEAASKRHDEVALQLFGEFALNSGKRASVPSVERPKAAPVKYSIKGSRDEPQSVQLDLFLGPPGIGDLGGDKGPSRGGPAMP